MICSGLTAKLQLECAQLVLHILCFPLCLGVVTALKEYYQTECRDCVHVWLSADTDHYCSSAGDKGWGCGYRNLQMLLSSLRRTDTYAPIIPGVHSHYRTCDQHSPALSLQNSLFYTLPFKSLGSLRNVLIFKRKALEHQHLWVWFRLHLHIAGYFQKQIFLSPLCFQ